jgi:hypothetical protein
VCFSELGVIYRHVLHFFNIWKTSSRFEDMKGEQSLRNLYIDGVVLFLNMDVFHLNTKKFSYNGEIEILFLSRSPMNMQRVKNATAQYKDPDTKGANLWE